MEWKMTDHEREVVQRVLSNASQKVRAAQRCIEVLANLFEGIRRELYPQQASRVWYVLNQIPNLERIPLYPLPDDKKWSSGADQHYHWHFMEHTLPSYEMKHYAEDIEELSEMLSGVKIEEVAESKGHEAYLRYMTGTTMPLVSSNRMRDAREAVEELMTQTKGKEKTDGTKPEPSK